MAQPTTALECRSMTDQGLELAAALDQPPVPLAEEGAGLAGRGRGVAEDALEVGVALGGLAGPGAGAGLDGARAQPGHDTRCAGVRNRVMSMPVVRHEVAHCE
jgi:hypothetical protein